MRGRTVSIRTLMAGAMALIITAVLLITGIVVNSFFTRAMTENTAESASEIITQVNNNLGYYISDIIDVSDYARNLSRITSKLSTEEITTRLEAIISSRDDLIRIVILDPDGHAIVSTDPSMDMPPEEITAQQWFVRAIDGEGDIFFTGPHPQDISSSPYSDYVISYSTVINYGDTEHETETAVLLIDLNFNAVSELLTGAHLASSGYIYIISNDGGIVYHPLQEMLDRGTFREDIGGVDEHVYGTFISEYRGRERLTIIQTVGQTRWRIVGVAFMDELMGSLAAFRYTLVALLVAAVVLAFLFSGLISSYITNPLRRLEASMRRVQDGDFSAPVPGGRSKEVASLSESYSVMIRRIEELMEEVRKTEAVKRQRELDALQAKINPHFLYNTLDSVVWMAETGNREGVVKMVTALANLFRISIAKGHDVITLKEELQHVRSYLEIQSMRYKDRFSFSIDLPESLEDAPTVKLIIQPIVENSIYHGIKYLQEEGRITITVSEEDGRISIRIADNGVGMPQDVLSSLLDPGSSRSHLSDGNGIGLENINERLKLYYGDEYGLSIESELDAGTAVTITIPHLNPIQPVVVMRR